MASLRRYLYIDVTDAFDIWKDAIREYQMVRGGVSSFAYFDYYTVALDVEESAKHRVLDSLR